MTDQLFLGMSKPQVKYVLGTPVINDTFTLNRWDYSYRYISPNGELDKKSLTLIFDASDTLKEIIKKLYPGLIQSRAYFFFRPCLTDLLYK